ncbi:MAG: efflux RND transporter permease subunit [Prevotellaceae bacterium]|nr:efflux RND transporter permease subunit [Candidatus Faecinaster equi]
MKKQYFFIKHKVMAGAIAILTLLIGFISLSTLSVEQYPDIAPPTIYVETSYTGADANSVMSSVIMPLEESINGVEHMMYMTGQASSDGSVIIQVIFEQGTDADMATVNVQNRVSKALGLLPSEVTKVGVQVYKSQNSILQINSLRSSDGKFDQNFIANYLDIHVLPRIRRVDGVGKVQLFGNTYSLRIWMKPDVMAQYGLLPNDVFAAIGTQNLVAPAGSFGESSNNTMQYNMEYKGRLKSIEEFDNIVIKSSNDGTILHLCDVADVQLGALSYTFKSSVDGQPGVTFIINQAAGANATEVNAEINELYKDIQDELPPGLEFSLVQTSDDFLFAAIHNVVETLIIAIILVILVVYFFLQDIKATIIPSISIIVSLIGTFAVVKLAGFSLNILTLFALVLAIGTVVDDAIVVVEAVMAKFDAGYKSSRKATNDAIHEVFTAIISCTLVFMAVFIPVTFMPGTSGTFFTQFGITIAVAVGLSGINALTLCPALCAMIMKPKTGEEKKDFNHYVKVAYNAAYGSIYNKYVGSVQKFLKRPIWSWVILVISLVLMVWLMKTIPGDLVPQEDQGVVFINVSTPPGYTLEQTEKVLEKVEKIVAKNEEVVNVTRISGYGLISGASSNAGTVFARLKNWEEREGIEHSINMIIARIYYDCKEISEAQVLPFQMPQIPGYGTGNSIELVMQDQTGGDMNVFLSNVNKFSEALQKRPEIASVYNSYSNDFPKYKVDIDASVCQRSGVSPQDVLEILGSYCAGAYISDYNQYGKIYRVMAQSSPEYRLNIASLDNMFIRTNSGEMAPLSQFVTLIPSSGSSVENHFNMFSSMTLNVDAAEGYSASQAMNAISEVFDSEMPDGFGYEYSGMSRETAKSLGSNDTVFIYCICILLIYLILACLYNSWFIPFAVLLSVPFGLMGAFAITAPFSIFGFTNNIYLQTGVIMLIGLLSKTAILITEFAVDKHKQGMSIHEAAFEACKDRLRPILMTVATMIIGMIPLVIEGGAGAMGNRSLALGVIGGMSVGTIALLFVVPVFYIFFQKLHEKIQGKEDDNEDEIENAIQ